MMVPLTASRRVRDFAVFEPFIDLISDYRFVGVSDAVLTALDWHGVSCVKMDVTFLQVAERVTRNGLVAKDCLYQGRIGKHGMIRLVVIGQTFDLVFLWVLLRFCNG